ncbi:hypothetical protein [Bacillus sp. AK128]
MVLKNITNLYNFLLSIGAFYISVMMFSGSGVFATFPQEWKGMLLLNDWVGFAIFTIIIFGLGNAIALIYGLIIKDNKIFIVTIFMGALFLICIIMQIILVGEWYLATVQFLVISLIQILLGSYGFVTNKSFFH